MNILYNLRQFYSVPFGLLPFQGAYDANKYEGNFLLTEGYFFHKIGESKEQFLLNSDSNNGHMFGNTKLELADDQIGFVANKVYSNNRLVIKAASLAEIKHEELFKNDPESIKTHQDAEETTI